MIYNYRSTLHASTNIFNTFRGSIKNQKPRKFLYQLSRLFQSLSSFKNVPIYISIRCIVQCNILRIKTRVRFVDTNIEIEPSNKNESGFSGTRKLPMPVVAASGVKFNFLWTFNSPASTPLLRSDGRKPASFSLSRPITISPRGDALSGFLYFSYFYLYTLRGTRIRDAKSGRFPSGRRVDIKRRERKTLMPPIYITRILSKIGFPFNLLPFFQASSLSPSWLNLSCSRLL